MGNWLAEVDEPPSDAEVALRDATRALARIWLVHTNVLPPSAVEGVHPQGQDVVPPVERRTMVREELQSDEGPNCRATSGARASGQSWNAWHLVRFIDEIPSYTRSEAGKVEVQRERVPVTQVVREVMEMLGPVSDDQEVEFRLTVPDEPHGGALKVESSGEGGTTFSIRLPRNAANGSDG